MMEIEINSRVMIFDSRRYIDDVKTPLAITMQPATVVCRYGKLVKKYSEDLVLGPYEDLVDVVFDHTPTRISRGHFTECAKLI